MKTKPHAAPKPQTMPARNQVASMSRSDPKTMRTGKKPMMGKKKGY